MITTRSSSPGPVGGRRHVCRFDLDLAPEEIENDRLSAPYTYPEWDYRRQAYLADHCRVLERIAEAPAGAVTWQPDEAARRRIRAVRRQFEALRPRREIARRQIDGAELDMDALIRSRCDLAACGDGSDQLYLQARQHHRDLAVAVLIDASRSTESFVENRQVIDVAKEALTALTHGLAACGDDHAIYSFSSCKRTRVWVNIVKTFEEPGGAAVLSRIAALKPGHYTRLGAAVRHVSRVLSGAPATTSAAAHPHRRQAQRSRPLRRALRDRGLGARDSRGAPARPFGVRHHHRPQGAGLRPRHVSAATLLPFCATSRGLRRRCL